MDVRVVQYTQINKCDIQMNEKDKNHNHLSMDTKKGSDKNQIPLVIKTFNETGIEGTYFKVIKAT